MSRLLTKEEIEALRAETPYVPAPRELFHIVVDAGHADLTPEEVDRLEPGDVIPLDRSAKNPVEIVANAVTVARGVLVEVDGRAAVKVVSLERRSSGDQQTSRDRRSTRDRRSSHDRQSGGDRRSSDRQPGRNRRAGHDSSPERIP